MLFETVWTFLKESVKPETVKKIHFLGSEFEEQLLKLVSKDNLPESLGGNQPDEDLIVKDRGPWVKDEDNSSHSDSDQEIDLSAFKAALSNVLPQTHQVPRREAQTPLNTESDEKN